MLRTLIRIESYLRHYVAGSAYMLAHLALHERRSRALMPDNVDRARRELELELEMAKPPRKNGSYPGLVKARFDQASSRRSKNAVA